MEVKELKAGYSKIPASDGTKIIFVSGPYKAETEEKKRENVWHATRVAVRLWELRWIVFSPINNSAHFEIYSSLPEEVFAEGDLKFLEFMDAVFMLKGWESSKGANAEYDLAMRLNKEIYFE